MRRGLVGAVALLAFVSVVLEGSRKPASASPNEPPVKVGEVSATPADAKLVKVSLEAALRAQIYPKNPGHRAVVSASVLACDERACAVSAILRDESRGQVFAIVRGSAKSDVPFSRDALLKTATEGAAKQIPKALQ